MCSNNAGTVIVVDVVCLYCSVFEAHPALCDAIVELMGVVSKDLNKTPATALRRTSCLGLV